MWMQQVGQKCCRVSWCAWTHTIRFVTAVSCSHRWMKHLAYCKTVLPANKSIRWKTLDPFFVELYYDVTLHILPRNFFFTRSRDLWPNVWSYKSLSVTVARPPLQLNEARGMTSRNHNTFPRGGNKLSRIFCRYVISETSTSHVQIAKLGQEVACFSSKFFSVW